MIFQLNEVNGFMLTLIIKWSKAGYGLMLPKQENMVLYLKHMLIHLL